MAFLTAKVRGWRGSQPPIVGVGAFHTPEGVRVAKLLVRKLSRAKTMTLTLHHDMDTAERVEVVWEAPKPGLYSDSKGKPQVLTYAD